MPLPPPQPRTYSITLRSLLALPFRICNPPPAVGKVRSCGVTPLIDVRLEDILDRQHLPPLGLKDFEEWLLFVELSPENLYFILWLREYKQRYAQWQSQSKFPQNRPSTPPEPEDPTPSAHLAMFFARAKQTFFTPGSAYELNLPSALLAPLHRLASAPPGPASSALHPHPSALRPVEREVYAALDASRARFVSAQLNNVGSRRVLCGILAGIAFCLIGAAAPLAALFARGGARWARLAALPGLWAGLTVLFASINGICMGVYIFGDLRQLRRFELARPRISRPRPLPPFAPIAQIADAAHSSSSSPTTHPPTTTNITTTTNPTGAHPKKRSPSLASFASSTSTSNGTSTSASHSTASLASDGDGIRISPAYFDADAHADEARGDLYAPRPESALDWDADADADGYAMLRGYGIVGGVDFSALEGGASDSGHGGSSVRGEGGGGDDDDDDDDDDGDDEGGESGHARGAAQVMPIPRVLGPGMGMGMGMGTTRSVRSASTASEATTVFTGTATFIHPFTLSSSSSPDDDDDDDGGADSPRVAHGPHGASGLGANAEGDNQGEEDDDDAALARAIARPAKHQRVAPFDFDGLPVWGGGGGGGVRARARGRGRHAQSGNREHDHDHQYPNYHTAANYHTTPAYHDTFGASSSGAYQDSSVYQDSRAYQEHHFPAPAPSSSPIPIPPRAAARAGGLRGALARMQERCGLERRRLQIGFLERPGSRSRFQEGALKAKTSRAHEASLKAKTSRAGVGVGIGAGAGAREMEMEMEPHWSSAYWRGEMGISEGEEEGMNVNGGGGGGRRSADSEKTHMDMDDGEGEMHEVWARDVEGKGGVHGSGGAKARYGAKAKGGQSTKRSKGDSEKSGRGKAQQQQQQDWWRSVPAFAVPLARILAPAVVRAHWEIVVRSAALAALVSVMVLVVVLAVPVTVPV